MRVAHPSLAVLVATGAAFTLGCSDGASEPADSAPASLTITGAATVDIAGSVQLTAEARNAAGAVVEAPVEWSSSDPAILTVSASGIAAGVARGAATVTASTPGATGTEQGTHEMLVTVASVAMTPSLDTLTSLGDTVALVFEARDAEGVVVPDAPVVLTATQPGIVTLEGANAVAIGAGTGTITAELDGRTAEATIVVRQIAVQLSLPATTDTLTSLQDTRVYRATAVDARGNAVASDFVWTSTAPSVAVVAGDGASGTATAVGNGTAIIRVTRDEHQAEATLVVAQQLAQVTVTPPSASLYETATVQLEATPQDARGNAVNGVSVAWSTSDAAVATVSATGLVTARAEGTATVVATTGGFEGTASMVVAAVRFAQHIQPVFTANCALSGCHTGAGAAQGMNLSEGNAYANIVNVQSNESALLRIKPFEPDSSYLIHKVQGTQASVGGSGERMPRGALPLSQDVIDLMRAWVAKGANNN